VKPLLDRLMARQSRLMAKLDQPAVAPTRPLSPQERESLREGETAALAAMIEPLSRGAHSEAAALLAPFANTAQEPLTLTTLARLRTYAGDLEGALQLLARAEAIAPSDAKVLYFMAETLQHAGRHHDAIYYWRRLAFTHAEPSAAACAKLIEAIVAAAPIGKSPPLGELRMALKKLREATDLDDSARRVAAWSLYRVRALAVEALQLLEEVAPCPPDQVQIEPRLATMAQWCEGSGATLHILASAGEPGRRPSVARLTGAIVHPALGGAPITSDGNTLIAGFKSSPLKTSPSASSGPILLDRGVRVVLRLPRALPSVDEECAYIGGSGRIESDLLECLGSAAVMDSLRVGSGLPLVVTKDAAPQMAQLLSVVGMADRQLITVDPHQPTRFRDVWLPSRLAEIGRWIDPLLVQWLRQRSEISPAVARSRRLFLVDAHSTLRIANQDQLVERLAEQGYEAVRLQSLTVAEMVHLFSTAQAIAGSYGPAMAYLPFAAPATRVLLLVADASESSRWPQWYARLGAVCGHTLVTVPGRVTGVDRAADARKPVEYDLAQLELAARPSAN
jgi:tetratricopeptide (TPR) repeat protein